MRFRLLAFSLCQYGRELPKEKRKKGSACLQYIRLPKLSPNCTLNGREFLPNGLTNRFRGESNGEDVGSLR
jgi:hypothetical protein